MQEGKIITVSEVIAYLQSNLNGSMHGEGGSGSHQNDTPQGMQSVQAASSSAPSNLSQDSDLEMQMD
ncbi:hypothetical protein CDL12_21880 [Handroanthus impetiginosus]|uniref:Uncharacterized protein n=1 Tax=Handroanthus impetiginosus TaxID=429701 RepID=A0A2G9GJV6_9LAMI|nr:hypothetical protein CDL12_21880 [Handroanthus impetiginosus]